jgi:hypothetical protein
MKRLIVFPLLLLLVWTAVSCSAGTKSYAYYEFYCEGDMTVTHGSDTAVVLSDEDESALLKLWGHAWEAGKATGTFDYEFAWENTTIHYNSKRGVFRLGDTKQILKLSAEERDTVEAIIEKIA